MNIQKKKYFFFFFLGGGGGQGGCEWRSEAFVKIQKKNIIFFFFFFWGGGGSGRGGVRVDGNGEVKFLSKLKKINLRGVGGMGWGR